MILWRDAVSILYIPLLLLFKAGLAHSKTRKFLKINLGLRICVCKYVHTQYFLHVFVKNATALLWIEKI